VQPPRWRSCARLASVAHRTQASGEKHPRNSIGARRPRRPLPPSLTPQVVVLGGMFRETDGHAGEHGRRAVETRLGGDGTHETRDARVMLALPTQAQCAKQQKSARSHETEGETKGMHPLMAVGASRSARAEINSSPPARALGSYD